ncbi:MAG TPA: hypothetical protein VJ302_21455 [Blastocatellia bacterium]|nr:hypothetical protein [Blastocatellia bacterium]
MVLKLLKKSSLIPWHRPLASVLIGLGCVIFSSIPLSEVQAQKTPKPEDVVERTILAYGGRAALYKIQNNGSLRASIKFFSPTGDRSGESMTKFIRKEKIIEDLVMIQLDLPDTKYQIGFDGKVPWTIHNGEIQTPSEQEVKAFRTSQERSYEAMLRYKENNFKLEYAGSYKLGTLDLDLIDLISPEGSRTRYEISRRTARIIYINYEDKSETDAEPTKYRLYFKNFTPIQNTLVPFETQVFQNGKLVEERRLREAVFNIQLDEKAFKAENANKPPEPPPGL